MPRSPTEPRAQDHDVAAAPGVGVTNWNELLVRALGLANDTLHAQHVYYQTLRDLTRNFLARASLYARIIVDESLVPAAERTVRQADVGGAAGGTKFVAGGILFKFATDRHGIYGCEEAAQKAAAHELMVRARTARADRCPALSAGTPTDRPTPT